jgi:hypothetical protein
MKTFERVSIVLWLIGSILGMGLAAAAVLKQVTAVTHTAIVHKAGPQCATQP